MASPPTLNPYTDPLSVPMVAPVMLTSPVVADCVYVIVRTISAVVLNRLGPPNTTYLQRWLLFLRAQVTVGCSRGTHDCDLRRCSLARHRRSLI